MGFWKPPVQQHTMEYLHYFRCDTFYGYLQGQVCNHPGCSVHVTLGVPLCPTHWKTVHNLEVRDSLISHAGKGLFATNTTIRRRTPVFKEGDIIVEYTGEQCSEPEIEERYPEDSTAPYAVRYHPDDNVFIDAALLRGIGAFANSGSPGFPANARFYDVNDGAKKVYIAATRHIYHDNEIYMQYTPNGEPYDIRAKNSTTRILLVE